VHNSKLKRITVALCMALVPISVFAAGLGKLNVMSGLGEPLKADIELISVTPEELSSITAAIASEEAYAIQGIEKPASHNTIKVDVSKNAAGAPILKLKSSEPISEPFLDMLIQVDWASGRLLREYTVLLDPPGYTGEADLSAVQSVQAPVIPEVTTPSDSAITNSNGDAISGIASKPSAVKSTTKKSKKPTVAPVEDAPVADTMPAGDASGQDHLTQSGDTLGKIAREMKPEGVSLEQMLVGLYQANPDAFQGNNMNRLKVGQIIRPPSEDELNAITRKEASSEIKVQTENWNAYRNKLAGMVADAAPTDTEASTQSAGGKIKSAAEDKSIPAATGPKDVVKLSAGDAAAAKADAASVKSLQEKITALQEEATAREKSVKEAQDRTASLEKQIADMQKLLALKNGAMSELQKQAEMQAAADKAKAEQAAEQAKAAEANAVKPEAEASPAKPMESAPAATEPPKPEATAAEPVKKPAAKPAPVPEAAPEQSFLDSILGGLDLGILAPAGGLLALLGGGWMYLRKKREKSLADFEQGIMTSGGLKANTVFGNTASASVDTGDTSFLTDFSQSANGGMIDTNDVDPIAEAEVYMAYGRDAQAEEILKDAISKEPKRYELHLKLLEMYAASKNMSAFETISGELYTTLGAEDPTWAKVAEIGIKLEPSNPLYQANSSPSGSGSAGASGKPADSDEKLDATDFSDSPLAAEKDLDFSFDNDALTQGFAPTGTAKSNEFDLSSDVAESAPEASVEAPAEVVQDAGMSFEMDTKAEPETTVVAENSGAMEFDMGDLGSSEVATPAEEPIKTAEDFGNTMPGLDIPTFAAPHFMPENEQAEELPSLAEATSETFEFPMIDETPAEGVLDISDMAAESAQSTGNDFSFDVHTIQPEVANVKDADALEPKTFDLNTIDLNLNDKADVADSGLSLDTESAEKPSAFASTAAEPIEVDTKLDLVAAYIEMDDKVGAKELLDEVMKEGGANQRKRAEDLLAKLT
jgi:pilus assembly protein FimV